MLGRRVTGSSAPTMPRWWNGRERPCAWSPAIATTSRSPPPRTWRWEKSFSAGYRPNGNPGTRGLQERRMRIGFGYDSHRLVTGRRLVLGGLTIPHDRGLLGHSDADVLIHAVCDAILGAASAGDI